MEDKLYYENGVDSVYYSTFADAFIKSYGEINLETFRKWLEYIACPAVGFEHIPEDSIAEICKFAEDYDGINTHTYDSTRTMIISILTYNISEAKMRNLI